MWRGFLTFSLFLKLTNLSLSFSVFSLFWNPLSLCNYHSFTLYLSKAKGNCTVWNTAFRQFAKDAIMEYHKLGTPEIYCLTVLEARSPKSRAQQGCFWGLWENLFSASHSFWELQVFFALPSFSPVCVSVCVQISPFHKHISYIGLGPTLMTES